jgi:hypothetical protein
MDGTEIDSPCWFHSQGRTRGVPARAGLDVEPSCPNLHDTHQSGGVVSRSRLLSNALMEFAAHRRGFSAASAATSWVMPLATAPLNSCSVPPLEAHERGRLAL